MQASTESHVPDELDSNSDRGVVLRKAYTSATQRLREEYPDRFNELRTEEAKALGVDWKPKPTAKDKAREQLQAILRDNPDLADEVVSERVPTA